MDSRDCSHRVRFHGGLHQIGFSAVADGATVACSGCTNRASKFVPTPQVAQRALADAARRLASGTAEWTCGQDIAAGACHR